MNQQWTNAMGELVEMTATGLKVIGASAVQRGSSDQALTALEREIMAELTDPGVLAYVNEDTGEIETYMRTRRYTDGRPA